jgi:tRNA threonylcarbamoyladenosine biosynthesis protein TsaB
MIVLGLDTATADTAVGLLDTRTLELHVARHEPAEGERPGHASQLLGLCSSVLAAAGASFADVERLAVGVGPGSFTGLRIGVATARSLAQAHGAEVARVGTLHALAHAARPDDAGAGRAVLAVLDARRREVFVAAHDADGAEVLAPRALPPDDLAGLGLAPAVAVGDGAVRFARAMEAAGHVVAAAHSPLHHVAGRALCELGARAAVVPRDSLMPDYVRAPDAVPKQDR